MIKKIILNNFMSHKHTEFDISNNVTVFVGQNGNGKSAIFHAIRWVFTNEPRGSDFLFKSESFIAKKASVTIITDNGNKIVKERTATSTKYTINDISTYHKTEVPEEIYNILGIDKVTEIGDTKVDLNFMFQMDSPFLLSESGGKNAIILSSIAGTESLDLSYSETNKQILSNTKEKKTLQKQKEIEENLISCLNQYNEIDMDLLYSLQDKNQKNLNLLDLSNQYFDLVIFKNKTVNLIENIQIPKNLDTLISYSNIQIFKKIKTLNTINKIGIENINFYKIKEYIKLKSFSLYNLSKIEFDVSMLINILLKLSDMKKLKQIPLKTRNTLNSIDTHEIETRLKLVRKNILLKPIKKIEKLKDCSLIDTNEHKILTIKELLKLKIVAENLENKIKDINIELDNLYKIRETKFKICPLCGQEYKEVKHIHG